MKKFQCLLLLLMMCSVVMAQKITITGKVINGHVVKLGEWKYKYDDGEYKIKNDDADYKKKVEKDGDVKIKDGDTKTKIDGETGEKKVKRDG